LSVPVLKVAIAAFVCVKPCLVYFLRALAFFWCVSSQAAVFLLTNIAFAFLASATIALFIRAVAVARAVVPIIFAVRIKGFRRLLRLVSVA
jgi:hypothetical protein